MSVTLIGFWCLESFTFYGTVHTNNLIVFNLNLIKSLNLKTRYTVLLTVTTATVFFCLFFNLLEVCNLVSVSLCQHTFSTALSVAPVIYWFSARLPLLSVAHHWQSFSFPAGLQSSSLSTAFLREISWKLASFICMQRKATATNPRLDFLNFFLDDWGILCIANTCLCGWGDHPVPVLSAALL